MSSAPSIQLQESEQLLLEKWRTLPEQQQRIVMDFVTLVQSKQSPDTRVSEDTATTYGADASTQAPVISEAERQRIVERIRAAQADRPQRLKRMKQRQKQGWEAARKIAQMLKEEFAVERVVLFGSMLNHEYMHEQSDIDLAVWGLRPEYSTDAWSAANYILSPYGFPPVDLVPIEKAYPAIKEDIEAEGVEL